VLYIVVQPALTGDAVLEGVNAAIWHGMVLSAGGAAAMAAEVTPSRARPPVRAGKHAEYARGEPWRRKAKFFFCGGAIR